MKKIIAISMVIGLFAGCQKKLTGYIEVHGVVADYFTKQPIEADIKLVGDDVHSGKNSGEHSITLDVVRSKKDGTYSLRSRPSKAHTYYLYINGRSYNDMGSSRINVKENSFNDVGVAYAGIHTFTCMVYLNPVSSNCIDIQNSTLPGMTHYNAGTTGPITYTTQYTHANYENNNHNLVISYQTNDCINTSYPYSAHGTQSVAISGLSTVLSTTINY